jgi:hypothetical protein
MLRNRIHAVAADHGYDRAGSYWTGPGRGWLAELDLPPVSREIITDSLTSLDALAVTIDRLDGEVVARAQGLHLVIDQDYPGLVCLENCVVMPGPPIRGDGPAACFPGRGNRALLVNPGCPLGGAGTRRLDRHGNGTGRAAG